MAANAVLRRKREKVGALTTHVLDTAAGLPAAGIKVALYRLDPERKLIASAATNADGRLDGPILADDSFETGRYELVFHVGDYFAEKGVDLPEPKFVDDVVLRFGISDAQAHYHVPLLVSPYSYSTYRGS